MVAWTNLRAICCWNVADLLKMDAEKRVGGLEDGNLLLDGCANVMLKMRKENWRILDILYSTMASLVQDKVVIILVAIKRWNIFRGRKFMDM